MRKLLLLPLMLGLVAFGGRMAGTGAPLTPTAKVHVHRGKPQVIVAWSDTNSLTIIKTEVRRRSTGSDTTWKTIGYTTGKQTTYFDPGVYFGKTYRYQARDSSAGAAFTAWSDSASVTLTAF